MNKTVAQSPAKLPVCAALVSAGASVLSLTVQAEPQTYTTTGGPANYVRTRCDIWTGPYDWILQFRTITVFQCAVNNTFGSTQTKHLTALESSQKASGLAQEEPHYCGFNTGAAGYQVVGLLGAATVSFWEYDLINSEFPNCAC